MADPSGGGLPSVLASEEIYRGRIIEVVRLPFARALAMAASGEIDDAKTIIGLLLAARRLGADSP